MLISVRDRDAANAFDAYCIGNDDPAPIVARLEREQRRWNADMINAYDKRAARAYREDVLELTDEPEEPRPPRPFTYVYTVEDCGHDCENCILETLRSV